MLEKPKGKRISRYKKAEEEALVKTIDLRPMNENQRLYIEALKTSSQVIVLGPSGTGKTFCAASHAANLYAKRKIDKIIITRPAVSVGKSLGALPGDLAEKFGPWLSPVISVLEEQLGKGMVETGIKNGNIVMSPLEYMRGSSFKDAFVLADECFFGDTEVLTESGFIRLDQLDPSTKVAQFDGKNFSFVTPLRKVEKDYSGKMVEHYRDRFSMTATENHDAVYLHADGSYTKKKFYEPLSYKDFIPVSKPDKELSWYDPEVVLACALQADGHFGVTYSSAGTPTHFWTVQISRSRKVERLERCLEDLGVRYSKNKKDEKGRFCYYIPDREVKYLHRGKEKNFNLKEILDNNVAACILFESLLWDGSGRVYCSTNKHNIDVIQACAHLSGYAANYGVTYDKRPIFKKEPKPYYRLNVSDRSYLSHQKFKMDTFDYQGKVYCVTVPSGMVIVRQKGTVFISGNCQNLDIAQFKLLVTRIGENCTLVMNGDIKQSDIKEQSGLSKAIHLAKKYNMDASIIEFTVDDIVRSEICKQWVTAFYEEGL